MGIAFCSVTGAMRARKSINIADIIGNIHWRRHLTAEDARVAPVIRIMPIRLTPVLRENPRSAGVYGLWHPSRLGLVELTG